LILDLENGNGSAAPSDFEVCVIGAGAAGVTLATDLARRGIRTLLLEAGGRKYEARSQNLYVGETGDELTYNGLYDGRFRILGGSTTQWAGQILEIDDFIFRDRPWVRGSGWPFAKSELVSYYKRAADQAGLAGAPRNAEEIWRLLGLQQPLFGPDLQSAFSDFSLKTNFAELYGGAIESDPNLTAYLHANACEFVVGDDGTTISGVSCRTFGGYQAIFRAGFIVLCAGGIESCRFLLQPNADGTVTPWNRRGMVGRHFQDHLLCYAADVESAKLPDIYLDFFAVNGYRFQQKMKLAAEAQKRLHTLDIAGFITYFTGGYDDMSKAYETVRWIRTRRYEKLSVPRLAHLAANFHKLVWHKVPYSKSLQPIGWSSRKKLKLNVNCEQDPLSEGRITLSSQRDELGAFRAKVDWRSSEQELHTVRKYVDVVREMFERNGLGRIIPVPSLYSNRSEYLSTIRDSFHHIGGTRMATSEANGVVDPDLKIFGTSNGYVCSTSVFPCAGFANPTHTLIALALRLSDHLQRSIVDQQRPRTIGGAVRQATPSV
jgi:choline dehydrogenase-like flavoprotein